MKRYDVLVIGSGPAGQKAAIQAAKAGVSVAVIEKARDAGGECVHRGTIPSKSLRECAVRLRALRRQAGFFDLTLPPGRAVASLLEGVQDIVQSHVRYISAQLERNGVVVHHGRARFVDPHTVEVTAVSGERREIAADVIVIATGSIPRQPPGVPIDHENVLDSDSILGMDYLPRSLVVLGAGVIASEYASVFASLGVDVTMINRGPLPVGFVDAELSEHFLAAFEASGGRYIGHCEATDVAFDGVATVTCTLSTGEVLTSDKVLVALGRVSNLGPLNVAAAGLEPTKRGLLEVDRCFRTSARHIYAVGDVAGPPALAATAMEQGRRAVCHALSIDPGAGAETIPVGIYTIPEMATVGLTEAETEARYGGACVGRARFDEIARGQISGATDGLLKLVTTPDGRITGAQIVGDGATELIHLAQMALLSRMHVDTFVNNVFNFPTMAEAYRVAALAVGTSSTRVPTMRHPKASAL